MKTFLYLADDIQALASGKVLAVGLFTDHVIVVNSQEPPSQEKPGAVPFSLLIAIAEVPPGHYEMKVVVLDPNGAATNYDIENTSDVPPGGSMVLAVKCNPFIFAEIGKYTVRTTVNGEVFENTFELRYAKLDMAPEEKLLDAVFGKTP